MITLIDWLLDMPLLTGITAMVISILDMYLTMYNVRLYDQYYKKYMELEVTELNPRYQEIVHQRLPIPKKEVGKRIIVGIMVSTGALIIRSGISYPEDQVLWMFYELLYGAVTLGLSVIIIRHVKNTFYYYTVKRNPQAFEGSLRVSSTISFSVAQHETVLLMSCWFIAFILVNRVFFLGATLSPLLIVILTRRWQKKTEIMIKNQG